MNEMTEFFFIGYAGEKNARRKPIDISDLLLRWPEATPILMANRPKEEAPYPVETTLEGTTLYWEVSESDVAKSGFGQAQVYMRDADGDILGKSEVINTLIKSSLNGSEQEKPPTAVETWVTKFLDAYEEAKKGYVSQNQGAENAGKVLTVGSNGVVAPAAYNGSPGGGYGIDDTTPSTTTTYSSSKINALLNEQKEANEAQDEEIAKRAKDADLAAVAKSGSYEDLNNKPTIPAMPTALPNPHPLMINGQSYDGSEAVSITIGGGSVPDSEDEGWVTIADITLTEDTSRVQIDMSSFSNKTCFIQTNYNLVGAASTESQGALTFGFFRTGVGQSKLFANNSDNKVPAAGESYTNGMITLLQMYNAYVPTFARIINGYTRIPGAKVDAVASNNELLNDYNVLRFDTASLFGVGSTFKVRAFKIVEG